MAKKRSKIETLAPPRRRGLFRGGVFLVLLQGVVILAIAVVVVYLLNMSPSDDSAEPSTTTELT